MDTQLSWDIFKRFYSAILKQKNKNLRYLHICGYVSRIPIMIHRFVYFFSHQYLTFNYCNFMKNLNIWLLRSPNSALFQYYFGYLWSLAYLYAN